MKDVNTDPDLPAKRPFQNSVEGDDSRMKKIRRKEMLQVGIVMMRSQ